MFGEILTPQTIALVLAAVGLPLLGAPEIFKGLTWLRGLLTGLLTGGKAQPPSVTAPTQAVGLLEAAQAADTLQRWYACRCDEAQKKLQEALRHILDPAIKPPAPVVDSQLAETLTRLLAARPTE